MSFKPEKAMFDMPPRIRARKRKGRCYELTGKGVIDNPDVGWVLVHGTVNGIPHAWFNKGIMIYDPIFDEIYTCATYRNKYGPVMEDRRYSHKEAIEMVLKYNHYGPWHGEESIKKTSSNRERR